MSRFNFWSITTGYDLKYLLPVGIEQLKLIESTSEKSEQVCFAGGHDLFCLILPVLLLQTPMVLTYHEFKIVCLSSM